MPDLPIPAKVWQKFLSFLRDERSGVITLHVKRGRVRHAQITEEVQLSAVADDRHAGSAVVDSPRSNRSAS